MSSTETSAHLLVYPFLSSGHIIPLLDLTAKLLDRGLTVTVAVTPSNLHLLDPLLARHVSPLLLPNPDIPPPSAPGNRLFAIIRSFHDRHRPFLRDWFRSHPSPPAAILSDFFLGWTNDLASELGIKRAVFSPSGALAFSVGIRTWLDRPRPRRLLPEETVTFPRIPNSPSYPWWQISHHYRTAKEGEPDYDFYLQNQLSNLSSWGIVFNSFSALEKDYIDHVRKDYSYKETRVWAVGPALPDEEDTVGPASRGGPSSVGLHELTTWLDSKPEGSVVYICFGSRFSLNRHQAEALAFGLEESGAHFLWCVRDPAMELPEGFEGRVEGRGRGRVIRGWAPQVAILRHPAVGSFLTHCGWNSTLEGVSAGVAMLTWPMAADQFANADLLVDGLGVGVRVGEAEVRVPSPEAVVKAVEAGRGVELRARAKGIGVAARRAVAEGGSSDVDLDVFVKELNSLNGI